MPHTRSAKKNLRKSRKRRLHNRTVKGDIKLQIKNIMSLKDGSPEEMTKELQSASEKLDKAAARGIIHRNTAARKKSQLAKMLNRKSAPSAK